MKMFKIKNYTDEEIKEEFRKLTQDQKINILIKFFGIRPLTEELFKDKKGIEFIKDVL